MSRPKLIFLICTIVIIILLIVIAFLNFLGQKTPESPEVQQPIPTAFLPTTIPLPTEKRQFTLVSINPPENLAVLYLPIIRIHFTFSEAIDPKTFYYQVTPPVDTLITTKGNTLTLLPKTTWKEGITTITISPQTTSAPGVTLDREIEYKINIGELIPEDDFEGE